MSREYVVWESTLVERKNSSKLITDDAVCLRTVFIGGHVSVAVTLAVMCQWLSHFQNLLKAED